MIPVYENQLKEASEDNKTYCGSSLNSHASGVVRLSEKHCGSSLNTHMSGIVDLVEEEQ